MADVNWAQRGRPTAPPVPCAQCHCAVDPIRAPRVGIYNDGYHYFCSPERQRAFNDIPSEPTQHATPTQHKGPELPVTASVIIERSNQHALRKAVSYTHLRAHE